MNLTSRRRLLLVGASVATLGLTLSACSSGGAQSTKSASSADCKSNTYTIAMITHEAPGDTFWDKIRAGAQAAAKNECIKLN